MATKQIEEKDERVVTVRFSYDELIEMLCKVAELPPPMDGLSITVLTERDQDDYDIEHLTGIEIVHTYTQQKALFTEKLEL